VKRKEGTMWVISFIRKHIFGLPVGKIFTTRDCLTFGRRGAIDQALSYLVKRGVIRRLARGVFVRDPLENMIFTNAEIAKAKAEAFGRRFATLPDAVMPFLPRHLRALEWPSIIPSKGRAPEPGIPGRIADIHERIRAVQETQNTFYIDGRTSKFRVGDQIIHLKQNSPRRMLMNKNKAGKGLGTLWDAGRDALTRAAIQAVTKDFMRTDREDMRKNARWMPTWLCDQFKFGERWVPVTRVRIA
jgi:hypothetical protein